MEINVKLLLTSIASIQSRTLMKDLSYAQSYSNKTPSARRKYDLAMLRNRSCPAVSHSCSDVTLSSISNVFIWKSTPVVCINN